MSSSNISSTVMLQVYKEREEEAEGSGDVTRVMDSIFKVMYASMEDNVVVDDEGNVSDCLSYFGMLFH